LWKSNGTSSDFDIHSWMISKKQWQLRCYGIFDKPAPLSYLEVASRPRATAPNQAASIAAVPRAAANPAGSNPAAVSSATRRSAHSASRPAASSAASSPASSPASSASRPAASSAASSPGSSASRPAASSAASSPASSAAPAVSSASRPAASSAAPAAPAVSSASRPAASSAAPARPAASSAARPAASSSAHPAASSAARSAAPAAASSAARPAASSSARPAASSAARSRSAAPAAASSVARPVSSRSADSSHLSNSDEDDDCSDPFYKELLKQASPALTADSSHLKNSDKDEDCSDSLYQELAKQAVEKFESFADATQLDATRAQPEGYDMFGAQLLARADSFLRANGFDPSGITPKELDRPSPFRSPRKPLDPHNYWPALSYDKSDLNSKFPTGEHEINVKMVYDVIKWLQMKRTSGVAESTYRNYESVMRLAIHFAVGLKFLRIEDFEKPGAFWVAMAGTQRAKMFAEALDSKFAAQTRERYFGICAFIWNGSDLGHGSYTVTRVLALTDNELKDLPKYLKRSLDLPGGSRPSPADMRTKMISTLGECCKIFNVYKGKVKSSIATERMLNFKDLDDDDPNSHEGFNLLPLDGIKRFGEVLRKYITSIKTQIESVITAQGGVENLQEVSIPLFFEHNETVRVLPDKHVQDKLLQAYASSLQAYMMMALGGQRAQLIPSIPLQSFSGNNAYYLVTPSREKRNRTQFMTRGNSLEELSTQYLVIPKSLLPFLNFYSRFVRPTLIHRICKHGNGGRAQNYRDSLPKSRASLTLFIHTQTGVAIEPKSLRNAFVHWAESTNAETQLFTHGMHTLTAEEKKLCTPQMFRTSMATGMFKAFMAGTLTSVKIKDEFLKGLSERLNTSVKMLKEVYIKDHRVNESIYAETHHEMDNLMGLNSSSNASARDESSAEVFDDVDNDDDIDDRNSKKLKRKPEKKKALQRSSSSKKKSKESYGLHDRGSRTNRSVSPTIPVSDNEKGDETVVPNLSEQKRKRPYDDYTSGHGADESRSDDEDFCKNPGIGSKARRNFQDHSPSTQQKEYNDMYSNSPWFGDRFQGDHEVDQTGNLNSGPVAKQWAPLAPPPITRKRKQQGPLRDTLLTPNPHSVVAMKKKKKRNSGGKVKRGLNFNNQLKTN
jgi:hypothetical protein